MKPEDAVLYMGTLCVTGDQLKGGESRRNKCGAFASAVVTSLLGVVPLSPSSVLLPAVHWWLVSPQRQKGGETVLNPFPPCPGPILYSVIPCTKAEHKP